MIKIKTYHKHPFWKLINNNNHNHNNNNKLCWCKLTSWVGKSLRRRDICCNRGLLLNNKVNIMVNGFGNIVCPHQPETKCCCYTKTPVHKRCMQHWAPTVTNTCAQRQKHRVQESLIYNGGCIPALTISPCVTQRKQRSSSFRHPHPNPHPHLIHFK